MIALSSCKIWICVQACQQQDYSFQSDFMALLFQSPSFVLRIGLDTNHEFCSRGKVSQIPYLMPSQFFASLSGSYFIHGPMIWRNNKSTLPPAASGHKLSMALFITNPLFDYVMSSLCQAIMLNTFCDESYITWTPSSNLNIHGLINN